MRKWLIAGVVLLLLVTAAAVAVLNLNSYIAHNKDYLIARAEQALGRKLSVGDVNVTLWGGIGVRLTNFAMADDPAFSTGEFVRAKDLQVNLKLLPLLRKEAQVKKMILHEPAIEIVRNEKGDYNFSTIGKSEKEKRDAAKKEKEKPAAEEKQPSKAFLVALVDISDGELRYRDRKDGTDLQLRDIELGVKDLDFDSPFTIKFAAALFAPKQNIKIKATVGPLSAGTDYRDLPLDGEIDADPLDMTKLQAAWPRLKKLLPGTLGLSGVYKIDSLKLKGTLNHLSIEGSIVGDDGFIRFGNSFQKQPGIPLALSTAAQYSSDRLVLRQSRIKLHNMDAAVKGEITTAERTAINLSIDSKPVSLEGWERIVPAIAGYRLSGKMELHATARGEIGNGAAPQIQGTASLENAGVKPPQFSRPIENLNAKIDFTGQRAELRETTFNLGRSKVRLTASIDRFAPLKLSYKLSTPELAPADFQALPEERKNDVMRNLASEGQIALQDGNLAVQAKLASGDGRLYEIDYKELQTALSLANKVADIRSLSVNAFNGALAVNGQYAFNGPVLRFTLSSKAKGVDLKQVYDTFGKKEGEAQRDVRGRLNAEMKLAGSGNKWEEIKPALRGQGQAEVVEGALLNFNIVENVLGSAGVPGLASMVKPSIRKKYPETFEAKDTKFKDLRATFEIADGRINIKPLHIAAADFIVEGNGWADFDRRVNFQALLKVSPELSADIAGSAREVRYLFNDQKQLEIPFSLSGKLPNVKPKPDSAYLAKALQRGFFQKGTEELQQRFLGKKETKKETAPSSDEPAPTERKERKRSSTEDRIRKGLQELFGR